MSNRRFLIAWTILVAVIVAVGFWDSWSISDFVRLGLAAVIAAFRFLAVRSEREFFRQLATLTPAERERRLAELPPEQKEAILRRLHDDDA